MDVAELTAKQRKFITGLDNLILGCLCQNPEVFVYTRGRVKKAGEEPLVCSITSASVFEDVLNRQLCMGVNLYFEDGFVDAYVPDGTYSLVEPEFAAESDKQSLIPEPQAPELWEMLRSDVALESAMKLAETLKVFNSLARSIRKYVAQRGRKIEELDAGVSLHNSEYGGQHFIYREEELSYVAYRIALNKTKLETETFK